MVHICTMHALCRIIEKLVYLYICFAWTMKPKQESEKTIKAIEKVLSHIGLHGGNVKIEEDTKRSTSTSKPPTKPSIGGVKARRFLSCFRKDGQNPEMFDKWKDLHNVVKDRAGRGAVQNKKANVWIHLNKIFNYLEKDTWSTNDLNMFQNTLETWKKSFNEAWNEQNITHYMVKFFTRHQYN